MNDPIPFQKAEEALALLGIENNPPTVVQVIITASHVLVERLTLTGEGDPVPVGDKVATTFEVHPLTYGD